MTLILILAAIAIPLIVLGSVLFYVTFPQWKLRPPRRKAFKVALGIVSFFPLIWLVMFLVLWLPAGDRLMMEAPAPVALGYPALLFLIYAITHVLIYYYMALAFRGARSESEKRDIWFALSFFLIVAPFFWYRAIWKEEDATAVVLSWYSKPKQRRAPEDPTIDKASWS